MQSDRLPRFIGNSAFALQPGDGRKRTRRLPVRSLFVAVIDDDEALCSSLADLMRSIGHRAEPYPTGAWVSLRRSDYAWFLAFLKAPQRALTREHLLRATRLYENTTDRIID